MQMFRLDSQRHINMLQTVIDVVEGEDVFLEEIYRRAKQFKEKMFQTG